MQISNQRFIVTKDLSKLSGTDYEKAETVVRSDIFQVLDYKLDSHRMRNKDGVPVRGIPVGRVTMTIESCNELPYTPFYEALRSNSAVQFTLISGSLNDDCTFNNYNAPVILDVYVTKIHEHFTMSPEQGRQYLTISVECLVNDFIPFPKR